VAFLFNQFPRSLDAFQRYRVSEPQTIFNSKQLVDNQPLYWDDQQTSGTGTASTYNTNQSSTTISVSALTAGTRTRQSFRSLNYQSGKSQLIFLTGVLGNGTPGIRRRIGYFNIQNGLFFQLDGTTMSVVRRTFTSGAPVDTVTPQAAWNIDKLDGTGPSRITLDTAMAQLFVIDFQWLGVGAIRFGFFFNGTLVYCHEIDSSNTTALVYMGIPNLPLRYEINNDGTGPAAGLVTIATSVVSEGGEEPGTIRAVAREDTPLITLNDAAIYPLVAIRLKSTDLSASVISRSASIACDSSATFRWMILLNPAVTGAPFSFVGIPNSAVEADVTRVNTTKLTGGTQLSTGYGTSTVSTEAALEISAPDDLQLGSSIAGVSDIVVLAVQRMTLGGGAETFYGSLGWKESR